MRKRRHWFRGLLGGLLLGIGLAIASIVYALPLFGPLTPWILIVVGIVIGLLLVVVPRPWGRKRPPVRSTTQSA